MRRPGRIDRAAAYYDGDIDEVCPVIVGDGLYDDAPTRPLCRFCGERLAAPKDRLLMGHCSRECLLDSLGETDSERGD